YGDFFSKNLNYLGADIDKEALAKVNKNIPTVCTNSLFTVNRQKYHIRKNEKLIIIGNPPYNDKTSIIRNRIKKDLFQIDENLKHRDLGISFLRSYELLQPEWICVLHPLSYLIKKTNFNALKNFNKNYRLMDSCVVSSQIFMPNSYTFFPIIIALYQKNTQGMDYSFIQNYPFKIYPTNQILRLCDFDFIANYVQKYPNHQDKRKEVAYFYTLRDINALKRSKTFLEKSQKNAVKVFAHNLKYYYYIHHFKQFAHQLPYYLGNLDIFIDNDAFLSMEDEFLQLKSNYRVKEYFEKLFRPYTVKQLQN
ncbi:MAG: hypothetical protein IKH45_05090, partial [Neisseriaceae bacterium]|nr:hypothetical protein [Neisseriaceae bacterium]